jgi:glycosyltransferase involved in cell wall biosynthesis
MKLIVQIPCHNEESTLALTVRDIPRVIPGIDEIEVLVIDDGSTDRTVEVARQCGADHIVSLAGHKGLAAAFKAGINASLARGADVIVNTDGDNQYCGADMAVVVAPIVAGRAEIVIGSRPIDAIEEFSFVKKKLQGLGSWLVRRVSGTDVPDATSGFRAYSREAALRINIVSRFTYTLEDILQAGVRGMSIASVPVRTNPKLRDSRLARSTLHYLLSSAVSMARLYVMYRPMRLFSYVAGVLLLAGALLGVRFLIYLSRGGGAGHVQSLILAAVLVIVGFQTFVAGLLGYLVGCNRLLMEEGLYHLKRQTFSGEPGPFREGRARGRAEPSVTGDQ